MLHIKLKGMEHSVPHKHIFCPYTHHGHLGLRQKVTISFSESSHIAYQIKGNKA